MSTFLVSRRYINRDTQQPDVVPLYVFTGADSSAADAFAVRANNAARLLWQYNEHGQRFPGQYPNQSAWLAAAAASLGALDPDAVADPSNLVTTGFYYVTEVGPYVAPTEGTPANEQERIARDIRDPD